MSLKDYTPYAATIEVTFHTVDKCLKCGWIQKNIYNEFSTCDSCDGSVFQTQLFHSYEDYRNFRLKLYEWRLDRSDEEYAKGVEIQRNELALDLL